MSELEETKEIARKLFNEGVQAKSRVAELEAKLEKAVVERRNAENALRIMKEKMEVAHHETITRLTSQVDDLKAKLEKARTLIKDIITANAKCYELVDYMNALDALEIQARRCLEEIQ